MYIESTEISNYDALKQYLTLIFVLAKERQIAIGGKRYYIKFSSGSSANHIRLDAFVRCNVSKKVDISLTAANLLNQREYRYAVTDYLAKQNTCTVTRTEYYGKYSSGGGNNTILTLLGTA